MKRLWMWFLLLNKRLYRKVTFLGLMLMIPVLVLSFYSAAGQSGGIVTIALAREDAADATAGALISELMSDSRVIQFQNTTPQEALELVQTGKADSACAGSGSVHVSLQQKGQAVLHRPHCDIRHYSPA